MFENYSFKIWTIFEPHLPGANKFIHTSPAPGRNDHKFTDNKNSNSISKFQNTVVIQIVFY